MARSPQQQSIRCHWDPTLSSEVLAARNHHIRQLLTPSLGATEADWYATFGLGHRLQVEREPFLYVVQQLAHVFRATLKLYNSYSAEGTLAEKLGFFDVRAEVLQGFHQREHRGVVRFDLVISSHGPRITEMESMPGDVLALDVFSDALDLAGAPARTGGRHRNELLRILSLAGLRPGSRVGLLIQHVFAHIPEIDCTRRVLEEFGCVVSRLDLSEHGECDTKVLDEVEFIRFFHYWPNMLKRNSSLRDALVGKTTWSSQGFELLGQKSALALLWTAVSEGGLLTDDEVAAIKAVVPRTRLLSDCDARELRSARAQLVLKPVSDSWSSRVFLGAHLVATEWETRCQQALEAPFDWVVQDYAELQSLSELPTASGLRSGLHYDLTPHVFWDGADLSLGHVTSRLSPSPYLNTERPGSEPNFTLVDLVD